MLFTLFLIFATLKFAGLVTWGWLIIFSPIILMMFINLIVVGATGKTVKQLYLEKTLVEFIKNYK